MKRIAALLIVGVLLYLIFVVAFAPASWLSEAATRFSNGSITLANPQGTFWRGTGELHAGGPATKVRHLGTVRWRVNPLWLFVGRAQLAVQLDGPMTRGEASVRVSWQRRILVQNLNANLPAQLLIAVYPPAAFFAPTGTLSVSAPNIELSRDGLVAVAEAQWRDAGGRFTGNKGVGDYQIEVIGKGETAAISVKTLQGKLDISGEGQWRVLPDGDVRFSGIAASRGNDPALEPLLRTMGRDIGGGRREMRLNAKVPIVQALGL